MPDQTPDLRFSQRQFMQAHRDRDEAQSRAAAAEEDLEAARARIAELEQQVRTAARSNQVSFAMDLWIAEGCPIDEFDGYLERNGLADTWANVLGVVREIFRPKCGKPTDGGPCVLSEHKIGPCYAAEDVGSSERPPHAQPVMANVGASSMPDNDIRTQAIELLASTGYARLTGLGNSPEGPWGELPEHVRTNWRQSFTQVVDVLLAAGWQPPAKPVGYITGYRNADGDWHVMFDGAPFATRDEATADAQAADTELPGVDWRALTVYDQTGEPYRAGER